MSELRRSGADSPTEIPAAVDRPAVSDRRDPELVDHRKIAPIQRDFIGKVRDRPPNATDHPSYSIDWNTGQPAGARTVQRVDENGFEKFSGFDTARRRGRGIMDKLTEKSEDITEKLHESINAADGIFHTKPPTHSVVGVPPPAHLTPPQYGAHTAGDVAAALTAAAFAATELSRRMHGKIGDWKERHGGNG